MTDREHIDRLFSAALDVPRDARERWLDDTCDGDAELRRRVEALLAAVDQEDDFLTPGGALQSDIGRALTGDCEVNIPERVGPFRIVRELGRGGMSVVYLAQRTEGGFEQEVAIKLMLPGPLSDQVLQRFEQERQILASLSHPGIARLLEGGCTDDGGPYFAMEFVEGLPLLEHCRRHGLNLTERMALFVEVVDAAAYAHARQIVHRDLKPSNVMVNEAGQVRLLDFGIAKLLDTPADLALTRLPVSPLTIKYASPEQLGSGPITTATDVYQLGVLLYELLTDRPPYHAADDSLQTWTRVITEQTPANPSDITTRDTLGVTRRQIRGDLDAIAMMALRKEPGRRYPSAAEFLDDLRRFTAGDSVTARRGALAYRAGKYLRRHVTTLTAVSVSVAALSALLWSRPWDRPTSIGTSALSETSIAVLPFSPGATEASETIGSNLTQQMWSGLAEVPELRVVGLESSLSISPIDGDFASVASDLGARTLVTGEVRSNERALEVTARLVDGQTGTALWSQNYSTESSSLLLLQRDILADILQVLADQYSIRVPDSIGATASTANSDAYELYLEAQHHLVRRGEGIEQAIELYETAVDLDPEFSHAWAGLAEAYNRSLAHGGAPDDVEDRIAASARRAIELNESLGTAYIALGSVEARRRNLSGAVEFLLKANTVSPNDPTVLHRTTDVMLIAGRVEEGLELAERLYRVNPLSASTYLFGVAQLMAGDFGAAKGVCDRTWERTKVQPVISCGLVARIESGDFDGAGEWFETMGIHEDSGWVKASRAYLAARQRPSQELRERAIAAIDEALTNGQIHASFAAYYNVSLGQLDRAFDVQRDHLERGRLLFTKLWWLPSQRPLLRDPRFGSLAQQAGLVDMWRSLGWPDPCTAEEDRIICE